MKKGYLYLFSELSENRGNLYNLQSPTHCHFHALNMIFIHCKLKSYHFCLQSLCNSGSSNLNRLRDSNDTFIRTELLV